MLATFLFPLNTRQTSMHLPSPDHGIITFSGGDAETFLQSQLTNDVAALAVGGWQWQGYCSAKGRLQATFALARTGEHAFVAVVHNSVAATLAKRLTMFRLRSKLMIALSESLGATLYLERPPIAYAPLATLELGQGRWVTVTPMETGIADAAAPEVAASSNAFMQRWNLLGIDAMQPEITSATADMFVPQMLNWDHVQPGGGVSFSKGCYPGQEIVARAHYRGAVKRQLERQILPGPSEGTVGATFELADGRAAEICNVVPLSRDACAALVVVARIEDTVQDNQIQKQQFK